MQSLCHIINKILPPKTVISLVGAGGKTSALFKLGEYFKNQYKIALTTTTHIYDPQNEKNRCFDTVISNFDINIIKDLKNDEKDIVVLGAGKTKDDKLKGLKFDEIEALKEVFDLIIVEADGAKKKALKAPDAHEPAVPPSSNIVIGVIGINVLGKSLNQENVHRPEIFSKITNCQLNNAITLDHIITLINHKEGLFKNCPKDAVKIVFCNQSEGLSLEQKEYLETTLRPLIVSFFF
ncbi:MAG: selenium cofactor biosynthesis protein YqeC [Alphaproteobacteria bacterium]